MKKTILLVALLSMFAAFAFKKPKPDDTIADLSKSLKTQPKANLAADDALYNKIQSDKSAAPTIARPPIASQEDFAALIKQTRFVPHPGDEGHLPYFDAMPSEAATRFGFPEGLKVVFIWLPENKDTLVFVAVIRPLRRDEEGSIEQRMSQNPVFAPELVAKLQKANPAAETSAFAVNLIPAGMEGGLLKRRPMLNLKVALPNINPSPKVVDAAVIEIVTILQATQNIWR
jgi:hypothetical protein